MKLLNLCASWRLDGLIASVVFALVIQILPAANFDGNLILLVQLLSVS